MLTKILGPLDGSKLGECALGYIREVATGCHISDIVLLTVLEPVTMQDIDDDENRSQFDSMNALQKTMETETREKAEDYLAEAAKSLGGMAVKTVVIPHDAVRGPAEMILDYADNNKVDLIVMSTHGRSGVSRWAMGSVSDRVVRYSKTPVLIVTPVECKQSK